MKLKLSHLRRIIQEELNQDLKNVHSKHEKTTGTSVLRKMHDAPGVLAAISQLKTPKEVAQVIEAILDAVPMVSRESIFKALETVKRHERATRK